MKKVTKKGILLGDILQTYLALSAITARSAFNSYPIDTQTDMLARICKRKLTDEIGDALDSQNTLAKNHRNGLEAQAKKAKDFGIEYDRLVRTSEYLMDIQKTKDELFEKVVDFEFVPMEIDEEDLKYGYGRLPDEGDTFKGEPVEWKGDTFLVRKLKQQLRDLVDQNYIVVIAEGEESTPESEAPIKGKRK